MSDKKIEDLEKRLLVLEENSKKSDTPKKEKVKRKPSEYNIFLSSEIEKIKKQEKDITHKDAWSKAVKAWKESKA